MPMSSVSRPGDPHLGAFLPVTMASAEGVCSGMVPHLQLEVPCVDVCDSDVWPTRSSARFEIEWATGLPSSDLYIHVWLQRVGGKDKEKV